MIEIVSSTGEVPYRIMTFVKLEKVDFETVHNSSEKITRGAESFEVQMR